VAFDSGVIVEIFADSDLGKAIYDRLQDESLIAYTSHLNLAEAAYITCRKVGHERARRAQRDLMDSGFIRVEDYPRIHTIASELKCERAISLVDCYTFAVAEVTGAAPVFAREEADLARENKKRPFERPAVFLS